MPSARTPNKRNELRSRVVADYASGGTTVTLDYDRNGNLTSDGERHRYVFNPFGQLVRILDYTTSEPVAEFAYSGVGHCISEKTDIDDSTGTGIPDATLDADDPTFYIATDPQGRRVATFRAGDTHPKETFVWTPAGVSGPGGNVGGGGGALILRDRVDDAAIPSKWANEAAGDTRPERHYHCSDSRLSVVALIALGEGGDGPTGVLAEQYRYSATGVPYGIPLGDVDGNFRVEIDGEVVVDSAIIADIEQEAVYQVRADLNLDGLVDSADIAIADAAAGAELGRGRLSTFHLASRMGFEQLSIAAKPSVDWIGVKNRVYRSDLSIAVSSELNFSVKLLVDHISSIGQSKDVGLSQQSMQEHSQPMALGVAPFMWAACIACAALTAYNLYDSWTTCQGWFPGQLWEQLGCFLEQIGVGYLDMPRCIWRKWRWEGLSPIVAGLACTADYTVGVMRNLVCIACFGMITGPLVPSLLPRLVPRLVPAFSSRQSPLLAQLNTSELVHPELKELL